MMVDRAHIRIRLEYRILCCFWRSFLEAVGKKWNLKFSFFSGYIPGSDILSEDCNFN